MALGKRRRDRQAELFVSTEGLARSPGHVFYRKLNELLAAEGFDPWVEELCRPKYADGIGRRSIPPGVYFRMLLVGYFEGLPSQRGIAWRCADSLSLREFLGIPLTEATPDHSLECSAKPDPCVTRVDCLGRGKETFDVREETTTATHAGTDRAVTVHGPVRETDLDMNRGVLAQCPHERLQEPYRTAAGS